MKLNEIHWHDPDDVSRWMLDEDGEDVVRRDGVPTWQAYPWGIDFSQPLVREGYPGWLWMASCDEAQILTSNTKPRFNLFSVYRNGDWLHLDHGGPRLGDVLHGDLILFAMALTGCRPARQDEIPPDGTPIGGVDDLDEHEHWWPESCIESWEHHVETLVRAHSPNLATSQAQLEHDAALLDRLNARH